MKLVSCMATGCQQDLAVVVCSNACMLTAGLMGLVTSEALDLESRSRVGPASSASLKTTCTSQPK